MKFCFKAINIISQCYGENMKKTTTKHLALPATYKEDAVSKYLVPKEKVSIFQIIGLQ